MGYTKTLAVGDSFTFGGSCYPSITFTTVAGSQPICEVTLPNIAGEIAHAFVDVHIGRLENTNGAVNYVDGASTLKFNGAGGPTCNTILDTLMTVPANSTVSGLTLIGTHDMVSYVDMGNTYSIDTSATFKAKQNNLILHDVSGAIRIIMR